jgi:hypothetical protein
MWTEILASYAAAVSTSALAISYLSYRSGGPQLSGSAEIEGRYDIDGPKLYIDVHNRGRGPITIDAVMLWGIGKAYEKEGLPVVGWPLHSPPGTLPYRIEGQSGGHWHFPAHLPTKEWLNRCDLARLEVHVDLGTGNTLILKVDTSNIDVLDGENLPDWEPDYFKDRPEATRRRPPSRETNGRIAESLAEYQWAGVDRDPRPA